LHAERLVRRGTPPGVAFAPFLRDWQAATDSLSVLRNRSDLDPLVSEMVDSFYRDWYRRTLSDLSDRDSLWIWDTLPKVASRRSASLSVVKWAISSDLFCAGSVAGPGDDGPLPDRVVTVSGDTLRVDDLFDLPDYPSVPDSLRGAIGEAEQARQWRAASDRSMQFSVLNGVSYNSIMVVTPYNIPHKLLLTGEYTKVINAFVDQSETVSLQRSILRAEGLRPFVDVWPPSYSIPHVAWGVVPTFPRVVRVTINESMDQGIVTSRGRVGESSTFLHRRGGQWEVVGSRGYGVFGRSICEAS